MPDKSDNMRCKKCGYDLRGQEACRCPECGRGFNPKVSSTYLTKPISGTRYVIFALISAFLVVTPFVRSPLMEFFSLKMPRFGSPLGILILILMASGLVIGMIISWYVIAKGESALKGKLPWIENRGGFTLSLFICGVVCFGFLGLMLYYIFSR